MDIRLRREVYELTPCVHGGRVEAESKRKKRDLLEFSASLNPLGPPPLPDGWGARIEHYPDDDYSELKSAAASFFGTSPECIVPGNGSSELIRLFAETVLERGDTVVLPTPTFSEYEFACRLFGASVRIVPDEKLLDVPTHDIKAVFVCNPNNPTGRLLKREQVLELAERCSDTDTALFVDEAFIELSDTDESVASHVEEYESLFVIRSLTKAFAVPGIRVGFAITSPHVASLMNMARLTWTLGALQEAVAIEFLRKANPYLDSARRLIREEREFLRQGFEQLGLSPQPSSVNYMLVDTKDVNSASFCEHMKDEGVLVRDCTSFGLEPRFIRVAVRTHEENIQLLDAARNALLRIRATP
ncbi:MAG: threonine-phosphate decarboxylase CobD [Methermicoccaceae archaeon]